VEGATPALGINGEIYVTWSGPKGLMFQVSKDDGNTWLEEERKIIDHVGGWSIDIPGIYRANGLPFLVSDLSSGPNRGNLYLNWCDQRKGENDTDVWLKISKDGGETWSADIRVNQDDSQTQQFFTHFTVDQSSGDLHFVFYDRSPFKEKSVQTNVAWVQSKDGGQTFKQETISTSPFVPTPAIFFGDYLNIAAVNGVVRPIWPRMDEGKITLWTALIQLK
jgi:Neuraminidase (sialidase)